MANSQFIASVHKDYLPFISLATDAELAQFVRAQICQASGEEIPELAGMAKALFDAHIALIERLEESSRKKSEAGKRGGNPAIKQTEAEVKQCPPEVKQTEAEVKPVSDTVSISVTDTVPEERENGAVAPTLEEKHKHGQFGWVKLTDAEYQRLIGEFGEETTRHYIAYVDESAQQTGNKNKWKDWNLTVRKAIKNKWGSGPGINSPNSNNSPRKTSYDIAKFEEMLEKGIF